MANGVATISVTLPINADKPRPPCQPGGNHQRRAKPGQPVAA